MLTVARLTMNLAHVRSAGCGAPMWWRRAHVTRLVKGRASATSPPGPGGDGDRAASPLGGGSDMATSPLGGSDRTILSSDNVKDPSTTAFSQGDSNSRSLEEISQPVQFDTHQLVRRLTTRGYSLQQAEELVEILSCVIGQSVASGVAGCVRRSALEKVELSMKGEVDNVKRDLLLVEKTDLANIKFEQKRMEKEMSGLLNVLKDEVTKVQSRVSLDINLERSKMKDQTGELLQKIKDTNNRIDTAVADLKTTIETHKLEMIKYLAGGIGTVLTLILSVVMGLWRLMK